MRKKGGLWSLEFQFIIFAYDIKEAFIKRRRFFG